MAPKKIRFLDRLPWMVPLDLKGSGESGGGENCKEASFKENKNTLKFKRNYIVTCVFFLIINTSYYWDGLLGVWAIPVTLVLFLSFFVLVVELIIHLYFALQEKFKSKPRLVLMACMTVVLGLTTYKPSGIINFELFEGKELLVARREGSANCMTTNQIIWKQ